ncbi:MAG: glycosyltransferase, partial [Planctomycetota bacterium]
KKWPDFSPVDAIQSIYQKAEIQPPCLLQPQIDWHHFASQKQARKKNGDPIHLVWAARWEHDKNADDLYKTLVILDRCDFDFQIDVMGQRFQKVPAVFNTIESEFSSRIGRWGYVESRNDYEQVLASADIFVSTAIHEFFGLSAAEAISAGAFAMLPDRLAYPELLSYCYPTEEHRQHLYEGTPESLAEKIIQQSINGFSFRRLIDGAQRMYHNLGVHNRVPHLDSALSEVVMGWHEHE